MGTRGVKSMSRRTRFARLALFLLPISVCVASVAAAPLPPDSADELVRRANEEFRAGNAEAADALYTAAEERTVDPGLVAFNRAAVLFERGDFREAERNYDRVLADAACPPARAAGAWYNRGTCLLNRGGALSVYHSAVACFENALASAAADEPLKADARHNLEIAKLLWIEAARKQQPTEPPSPNDQPPPEEGKKPKLQPEKQPGGPDTEPGQEDTRGAKPQGGAQQVQQGGRTPTPGDQTVAGNNPNLLVPEDTDAVQNLSPEEAREYLKRTAERRKRELQSMLRMLYGPHRADVQDW